MSGKKEVQSKIDKVKELAALEHPDIRFITGGNVEGSTNQNEFAVATDEGLFFYHYKNEKLNPLIHSLWKNVSDIKVDYLAMRTNLTLDGQNYRLTNEGKQVFSLASEKSDARVEKVERKWHQKILGFRSGAKWKKITAVIAYLLLFGFIGSFFIDKEEAQVVAEDGNSSEAASQEVVDTEAAQAKEIKLNEERIAAEEKEKLDEEAAQTEKALAEQEEVAAEAEVVTDSETEYIDFVTTFSTVFSENMNELGTLMGEARVGQDDWTMDVVLSLAYLEEHINQINDYQNVPERFTPAHDKLKLAMQEYKEVVDRLPKAIDNLDAIELDSLANNMSQGVIYVNEATELIPD